MTATLSKEKLEEYLDKIIKPALVGNIEMLQQYNPEITSRTVAFALIILAGRYASAAEIKNMPRDKALSLFEQAFDGDKGFGFKDGKIN
jgi:hypothetical protein